MKPPAELADVYQRVQAVPLVDFRYTGGSYRHLSPFATDAVLPHYPTPSDPPLAVPGSLGRAISTWLG